MTKEEDGKSSSELALVVEPTSSRNKGEDLSVAPQTNGITTTNDDAVASVDTKQLVTDNNTAATKQEGCEQSSSHTRTGSTIIPPLSTDIDSSSSTVIIKSEVEVEQVSCSGPVPNFRVEGSDAGDSSVTVVTSLSLSSSALQDCCGGGGSESEPSSEDMKLSLVSWYSEPDDAARLALTSSTSSACCPRQTMSLTGSLLSKSGSEEKENQTPEPRRREAEENDESTSSSCNLLPLILDTEVLGGSRESVLTLRGEEDKAPNNRKNQTESNKHVQLLLDGKNSANDKTVPHHGPKKHTAFNQSTSISNAATPECGKCARKSKSGNNTPHGNHQSRIRTPASRRLMPSTKSSTELKKPIKSILKSDSRSGSGSDNKSSMDSLPSADRTCTNATTPLRPRGAELLSRSESTTRAKFNLNHEFFNADGSPSNQEAYNNSTSEERLALKLRRIEKYATLRLRKTRVRPLELGSDSDIINTTGGKSKAGTPTTTTGIDLMTKSMSFLEKGGPNNGDATSLPWNGMQHGQKSNSLKRQGSLRIKNRSSPPWEPCTTRTTALRMQKMQESKAKGGGTSGGVTTYSSVGSGSAHTGSTHSGSGDSIHHLVPQSRSAPSSKTLSACNLTSGKGGDKFKVFAKLSSAGGQTASSNQKRLKQEKSVQTDVHPTTTDQLLNGNNPTSMSPIPSVDAASDLLDQIKQLEKLANRYRNTALKFQSKYESSEAIKSELAKQLQETQQESSEMVEFLQAEKSTLAESLTEIETEATTWREEIQGIRKESDSRISTLVRLSEQHKQEALRSQLLLQRLESQSNSVLASISNQISEGTTSIVLTRQKVNSLTECLIEAYKIPQELLTSFANADPQTTKDTVVSTVNSGNNTQPNSSLLLPLITSLAEAFPTSAATLAKLANKSESGPIKFPTFKTPQLLTTNSYNAKIEGSTNSAPPSSDETDSLRNLNQAIMDREAAETIGLDQITLPQLVSSFPEEDDAYLTREIVELNSSLGRLLLVVRVIVVQCDKQVSNVASSILQCLQQEGSQIKSPGDSSTPHNREDTITTLTTGEKVDASHRPLKNGHTIT
ncbi:uncharacterized protein LOC110862005 isoform X2 [Folsomia candida]|uniref:uncharacterized protein LOC110862005 isoform X2 n=1 Tax=Folsomia candida TaxID=158441 RepID=UPI000B905BB0|nr:uncharacterized protein LOC110862005 isoform X2 [Folsomia candida]